MRNERLGDWIATIAWLVQQARKLTCSTGSEISKFLMLDPTEPHAFGIAPRVCSKGSSCSFQHPDDKMAI